MQQMRISFGSRSVILLASAGALFVPGGSPASEERLPARGWIVEDGVAMMIESPSEEDFAPFFSMQLIHDGTIIDRPDRWDGYPTHVFDEGKHKIWFCSQGPNYTDQIRYTEKVGSLGPGGWSWWPIVLQHSQVPWASNHICDPAVLRFDRAYQGTVYKYIMYHYCPVEALPCRAYPTL
jgi:hypothetical protein